METFKTGTQNSIQNKNYLLESHSGKNSHSSEDFKDVYEKISFIKGWRLSLVEHYIKDLINRSNIARNKLVQISLNGSKVDYFRLQNKNNTELLIDEEFGVRLALLFKSIKIVETLTKVDNLLKFIKSMSKEEAYYWFSKCFFKKNQNSNIKAFKILALS